MFRNYLRIAIRTLLRQKLFTVINIVSLSVGIACCILIMLFIKHELSFDKFHHKADRIFRTLEVERKPGGERFTIGFQPLPLGPALEAEYPEIQHTVRIFTGGGTATFNQKSFSEDFVFTDPAFFEVFDFPLILGDPLTALVNPNSAVITQRIAEKYFGDENPIGKQMVTKNWRREVNIVVQGVVENPPQNSSIQFDFLMHIKQYPNYERNLNRWTNFNGSTYILLEQGADVNTLQDKTQAFVDKYWGDMRRRNQEKGNLAPGDDAVQLHFQPIKQIHLDTSVNFSPEATSNPLHSYILAGIALLVLLIACINFVMLAIGQSTSRAKEVGVRKILGAQRIQLVSQFWGETLFLCGFALVLGIVLAELLLPVFNQLAQKELTLNLLSDQAIIIAIAGLLPIVGLLAGSYPAAVLSRFQPVSVLKGFLSIQQKSVLIRVLIIFQFGLSIFLMISTSFMVAQQRFISTKDLGFKSENLIALNTFGGGGDEGEKRMLRLRKSLSDYPQILGVTGTSAAFNRGWDINSFMHNGVEHSAFVYRVGYDYLDMLDIELREGRNFSRDMSTDILNAVIVNEALVEELEWQEPFSGQKLSGWQEKKIVGGPEVVGVVKDYHFLSLREEIRPVILMLDPEWSIGHIFVRIDGDNTPATLDLIRNKWSEVAPNVPFEYSFIDEDIARQYESELRWQKILTYSASIAVILACFGLFGLSTLSARSRIKEIGIRKVLGATVSHIVMKLSNDFLKLVLLANLIAWPVAYYTMNKWLQNFAYRIEMDWWVFALAGGLALFIALLTVSTQAIRTALANPVEALRYE